MKKLKILLVTILFVILVLTSNCYAFDFEFNSNKYSINYDIPAFPVEVNNNEYSYNLSKDYILIYNCDTSILDLICFNENNITGSINIIRSGERIKFNNFSGIMDVFNIDLTTNSWTRNDILCSSRYLFPSSLGDKVILYKSENITIDSSVYDISSDGSVTLDYIYKQTEITPEGYKYQKVEPEEPTQEDTIYTIASKIYTIVSVLTFTIIIIFLYKYLKSNFAFRSRK